VKDNCHAAALKSVCRRSVNPLMTIQIVNGDLLDQNVDVIVNAWNRNFIPWWLLLPHGVSGAIKRRGGYGPFRELGQKGILPLGGAVETSAGRLPFKAIIHVAGIGLLWTASERSIRDSVANAIAIARQRGYRSIAFPIIGAGTGGFGPDGAIAIIQDALQKAEFDGEVRIVRFAPKS
jgi:O-acetyl-ADP-ribose deacetylase (regulator of RNase III)